MRYVINKLNFTEKDYPPLLREIVNPPQHLNYLGTLPPKDAKMIAIVGTRKATSEGKRIAKKIAKKLSAHFIVVSGLALGIDAAAHEGALEGGGKTVAVLANGLSKIYPSSNENLAKKILEKGGCIFSEYEKDMPPLPHQFLERNRIISGLSVATVVIEAPERSGALVTARNAAEQGREVFVIPGPADHPNYRGSHLLIRKGARLVASAENILEDLGIEKTVNFPTEGAQKIIFDILIEKGKLDIYKITEYTKLPPEKVSEELTMMTLEGLIGEKEGKFWIK
jgi:DNA processing protein